MERQVLDLDDDSVDLVTEPVTARLMSRQYANTDSRSETTVVSGLTGSPARLSRSIEPDWVVSPETPSTW